MSFRSLVVKRIIYALFLCFAFSGIFAQTNTDQILPKDSVKTTDTTKIKNTRPRNAAILSAVVPGAGQIYNHKYWKAPVIYAGFGGLGYMIYKNNTEYQNYRNIYRSLIDTVAGNEIETPYSSDQLRVLKEGSRRNRDFFIIIACAWYAANIVDAVVDAHLYDFDVSDDLSLNVSPYFNYNRNTAMGRTGFQSGVTLNFRLKK